MFGFLSIFAYSSPQIMAKTSAYLVLVIGICVSFFGLSSCRKNDRSHDTELQSSRDMSLSFAASNDILRQMEILAGSQADLNTLPAPPIFTNNCTSVTVSPALPNTSFPKVFTIDYGNTNCQGPDGGFRRGQIIATLSGNYRDSLTTISISTNNYFLNDNSISGTYTISNKGRNAAGHPCFSETVTNGKCIRLHSNPVSWNSRFTREWIQGDTSATVFDDVYLITGNATGTSSESNSFAVATYTPLRFAMNCPWFESGTLYLIPAGLSNRFIDFGTGSCDNQAAVWIFGAKSTLYLD
jgi:hypothetical protein